MDPRLETLRSLLSSFNQTRGWMQAAKALSQFLNDEDNEDLEIPDGFLDESLPTNFRKLALIGLSLSVGIGSARAA